MTCETYRYGDTVICKSCKRQWEHGETVECMEANPRAISPPKMSSLLSRLENAGLTTRSTAARMSSNETPMMHMEEAPEPALQRQEGGKHYKGFVIQPVEFLLASGYDFCLASAVKYLSRWREKNGIEDLRKAVHFIQLRVELIDRIATPKATPLMSMNTFIDRNRIPLAEAGILRLIEMWSWAEHYGMKMLDVQGQAVRREKLPDMIIKKIKYLIEEAEGDLL